MENEDQITEKDVANVERALVELIKQPIQPGTLIQAEFFENVLGLKRGSITFSMLISEIRNLLLYHGFYLSGTGHHGDAFEILDYSENQWIAKLKLAKGQRELERAYILLKHTPTDNLTSLQKKRHENTLREVSMKLAALQRIKDIDRLLKNKHPILVEPLLETTEEE